MSKKLMADTLRSLEALNATLKNAGATLEPMIEALKAENNKPSAAAEFKAKLFDEWVSIQSGDIKNIIRDAESFRKLKPLSEEEVYFIYETRSIGSPPIRPLPRQVFLFVKAIEEAHSIFGADQ